MTTRLLGLALATILLLVPSVASAQHRGSGRAHGQGRSVVVRPVGPGIVGPRIVTPGRSRLIFARPYYAFRPYAQIRSGLFLGYSVPYPSYYYNYGNPYTYPYGSYYYYARPAYPYIPAAPYMGYGWPYSIAIPNATPSAPPAPASGPGGVSFEVIPADAAVFVDGVYVGKASDFSPSTSPLSMASGRHRFELRALGYESMEFDADIVPDQVLPYQATLRAQ
jgi:hypothetical protein